MKQHKYYTAPVIFSRVLLNPATFWSGFEVKVRPDGSIRPCLYGRSMTLPRKAIVHIVRDGQSRCVARHGDMIALIPSEDLMSVMRFEKELAEKTKRLLL